MVGAFRWRRIPDYKLDYINLQLRYCSQDWQRGAVDYKQDEYHMHLGVYEPDVTQEEMDEDGWYIGRHVMIPRQLVDIEEMYTRTQDYSREVFEFTENPCNIFGFHIASSKRNCYYVLRDYRWIDTSLVSHLRCDGVVPEMAFVPYLIRVLLSQTDLVTRLCDVSDTSLTPSIFLSRVQQYTLDNSAPLFGFDVKDLLFKQSQVFKLRSSEFWDVKANPVLGQDPCLTPHKFRILCSNSMESWLYACRSLELLEFSSRERLVEYVTEKYECLDPFDLNLVEAKLGIEPEQRSKAFAVMDLSIPSRQFVPHNVPKSLGGTWASFTVGQRAALLHVRKIQVHVWSPIPLRLFPKQIKEWHSRLRSEDTMLSAAYLTDVCVDQSFNSVSWQTFSLLSIHGQVCHRKP
eukprot:Protomagalhaensia_wolfi_Nauph_80__3280@NODE_333_length_2766_cov_10_232490_g250_i0_p1_GENE_NODE_333_length_2766_cov_10_232490_g250_i0NODE_333_length_2766_cov_10_232490_g250_i0_p1_ORF_typecomplete_len404_score23_18_NODE_333_length_2766_cov_10_232490_g250_i011072318